MTTGKVLRFDEFRGYGFIAPDDGGEDVFMHANDLRDDKYLFRAGLKVEFEVEDGDKGLKASNVRIIDRGGPGPSGHHPGSTGPIRSGNREDGDDGLCDVLSPTEFQREFTEALLDAVPSLTAAQIVQVRRRAFELARSHNWIES